MRLSVEARSGVGDLFFMNFAGANTLQVGVISNSMLLNYAVKRNATYMELLGLSPIRQACRAPPGSSRLKHRRS